MRAKLEYFFESLLWNSRLFVILAVVFSLIGSILLFFVASADILKVVLSAIAYYSGSAPEGVDIHEVLLSNVILAVDLYLIAVVLLIFAFGLYELFISKIDVAEESVGSKVLEIHTLDQLKDKLAKVIVMVLIVSFFNRVLHMEMKEPLDMFYFAISILALALGLYFLHKDSHGKH
ncbi:YqhA family protein [Wolinella succinogenes]|uniref:YqhA family protein n=1 Tax=Wolinella succinogenes TaxID=844 RepID=UPI00240A6BF4|nr:YqhA family protein [Wolinella succinogenes]